MRAEERIGMIKRLVKRDGPGCFYCHCDLTEETTTLDHFIPRAMGGPSTYENFRNSCQPCNNRKGSLVPDGKRHPVPAPRARRKTRAEKQAMKALRTLCEGCWGGRINTRPCMECGTHPMPPERSHVYKVKAFDCKHDGETWCWFCTLMFEDERVLHSQRKAGMLVSS